jgi:hypothetical protein
MKGNEMDRTRKATREGNEITLQHVSPKEAFLIEQLVEDNLTQLLASVVELKKTPEGNAELQRRTKAFGECQRIEDETPRQFYDKLRRWMDQDVPPTRTPLHPPRQVEESLIEREYTQQVPR